MPALARPCAPLMLKLASMQVAHWYCGCTTPNQSTVMQCLLRKSWPLKAPLILDIGPWGPHSSTYGVYLPLWMCGWWIHITIPNQSQVVALIAKKKPAPLYWNIGPWGSHTSTYGANLPLWMCKWSKPITIPNQSQVAALVAKKK